MCDNNSKVLTEFLMAVLRWVNCDIPLKQIYSNIQYIQWLSQKMGISVLFVAADMNNHSVSVYKSFESHGF